MAYIFMDESGCLGFDFTKKKTSKHFIVTFLFVPNKRKLEKLVRKTFLSMPEKERRNHTGVLHANKEKPLVRTRLLSGLLGIDGVGVMVLRLNKSSVYTHLQDEKSVLYNYITNILLDRITHRKLIPLDETVHLIASQRETNRFLNENFKSYLQKQGSKVVKLDVTIKTPAEEKGLQAADFISWSLFRHYEHGDSSYMDMFRRVIVEDRSLFQ